MTHEESPERSVGQEAGGVNTKDLTETQVSPRRTKLLVFLNEPLLGVRMCSGGISRQLDVGFYRLNKR